MDINIRYTDADVLADFGRILRLNKGHIIDRIGMDKLERMCRALDRVWLAEYEDMDFFDIVHIMTGDADSASHKDGMFAFDVWIEDKYVGLPLPASCMEGSFWFLALLEDLNWGHGECLHWRQIMEVIKTELI